MTAPRPPFIVGGLLALAIGAFAWGRSSAPVRVETRVKVDQQIVYRDRVETKTVKGPVRVRTVTHEIPGPLGPERIVERIVERGPSETETKKASEAISEKRVETLTLRETVQPRLMVGASAGAALGKAGIAYGGFVNYRVAGPLWLGVAADSSGSGRVQLGLSF